MQSIVQRLKPVNMSEFKRHEVIRSMEEQGVVPLFYHADPEVGKNVLKACYDGGFRIFEFINRGDFAHEVFGELVKFARNKLPGLILGVGSVVDEATASIYIQLGASFVVSPLLNEAMADACNRRKVMWMPGCATPTEIARADSLGADIVKVYPAALLGGPAFIKAMQGPCPWTRLMPSGGVAPEKDNLDAWFKSGACCVGMGSKLITADIIKREAYHELENKVREVRSLLEEIR